MLFDTKQIILKDGRTAVLRSPCVEDAEKMLCCCRQCSLETDFLSRYPEEWSLTIAQEETWITRLRSSSDKLGIVCCINEDLVGSCEINFHTGLKTAHRASIAIALLKDYWNFGIGSAMLAELVDAAQSHGIEIIDLDLIDGNERAMHLYKKFGFHVVAEIPNAFKLKDGSYLNEIHMQKYL